MSTDPWAKPAQPDPWASPNRNPNAPQLSSAPGPGPAGPAPASSPPAQPATPNQASRFGPGVASDPHAPNANRWQQPPAGGWASKDYSAGSSQTATEMADETWQAGATHMAYQQPHQIHVQPSGRGPMLAAVASFFIPGLGQLLLGQEEKGMVIMGVWFFTVFGFFGILHLLAPIDAFMIGLKMRRNQPVRPYEFF